MTGQEIQDRVDALVVDLQTAGKGQTINIAIRNDDNSIEVLPLSSTAGGVVNAGQLATLQGFVDGLKAAADEYTGQYAPVQTALDNFNARRATHQALIDAASAARTALNDALTADVTYQNLKGVLDDARAEQDFINARTVYENLNCSENYAALQSAKGEYSI